jgi:hypothetical protein
VAATAKPDAADGFWLLGASTPGAMLLELGVVLATGTMLLATGCCNAGAGVTAATGASATAGVAQLTGNPETLAPDEGFADDRATAGAAADGLTGMPKAGVAGAAGAVMGDTVELATLSGFAGTATGV